MPEQVEAKSVKKKAAPTGKVRLKNTLSQSIPVQLFKDGKLVQRNLTRKESFYVDEAEISPALQSQIDSKVIKRYN